MITVDKKLRDDGQDRNPGVIQTNLDLLKLVMNNIPQAVFWKDRDLVYLGCNQAFADDTGFSSPEDIVGKTDFDMPWKDQAELYRADDQRVLRNGEPKLNYEEPQTTPDGSTIWLSTSKIPVHENGRIVAVLGMYEDITERKQVQQTLQESEERYSAVVNQANDGVTIIQDNLSVFANKVLADMLGYSQEELKDTPFINYVAAESRDLVAGRVKARLAGENVPPVYEARLIRKDGTVFDAELSSGIIQYHGKSADVGLIRDITARKQAEAAVQESQARFQGLVETLSDWIWEVNQNGIYTYVSPKVKDILGYEPKEVLGKTLFDLMPPEEAHRVAGVFGPLLSTRKPLEAIENTNRHKDGRRVVLETSGLPFYDVDGYFKGYRGTDRDVTQRKHTEALLRSMVENAPEAIGIVDLTTGLFTDPNENAVKLYGLPYEELLKVGPAEMSPAIQPDGRNSIEKAMEKINAAMQGEPQVFEWTHRNARGREIPCEIRLARLPGDLPKVRFTATDITDRKRVEQTLQESEARYSAVVNQANDGVIIIQDNTCQFVNQYLGKLLGYTPEEMLDTPFIDYVAPESRALLAGRVKARLAGENVPSVYEAELQRKDGTVFEAELSAGVIQYRGKSADVGLIRDITGRKRTEQSLRESEERFRRFTEATAEGLVFHEQGKIVDANPAAVVLFGLSGNADFIGKSLLEFLAPESHQLVLKQMQLETVLPYEVQCIRKDGSTFPVETSTRTYKIGDRTVRATSVRDITDRKQLEQQLQTAFERRGRQVQLSTQVSQSIASATSLEDLYQRVVTQVKDRFGYYHTQLLRYHANENAVVLVTGYGETGAKMLAAGHSLPMGEGLIGTAASTGVTVLRPVLENDPDWHPNPLLPETRGEIAVPIKLGENILGVLDVQSNVAGSLGSDDQLLLEGLCGQIATAIEGTRLRQEMTDRLEEINRLYRAMSHEGWQAYRAAADFPTGFMFDQAGTRPVESHGLTEELFARIPLTVLGGEVIGSLSVADDPQHPMTLEDRTFLQQISEQVTLALESARLFEQTQVALSEVARRASELDTVARMSATTSTVLDPDTLLQTVVDLTKERFGVYHAHIYLADSAWQTLLLSTGAGEVGRKMVADGLAIAMDAEKSLVARAARERQAVIVNDVRSEPGFLANPSLPDTRSEIAVPMIVGDKVLGVFDVQSDQLNGFTREDANIYTTLSAQVAVALQNARLYVEQAATVTQLRELDRLKSAFLANMSHELRTPLNSILGFSDVILEEIDGPLTETMHNDLHLIQKNGQHLLHLINDVLDMAKIEAGRINLSPERFMVHEILDDVLSITSTLASEKNLALFVENGSDNDVELFADRTRLRQVMINLINNSIKFTDNGKIAICAARQGTENILISVKDTGVGIPPDKLEAIFQEFAQIDTSSTRKAGGTGLGLPISRRLIELHGGRLWAESSGVPGEGSIFYVDLPIEARITEPIERTEK